VNLPVEKAGMYLKAQALMEKQGQTLFQQVGKAPGWRRLRYGKKPAIKAHGPGFFGRVNLPVEKAGMY